MKATQALFALALSVGLAACGGGYDDAPVTSPNEVPASATVSSASYSQYAGSLVTTETGRPLDSSNVRAPTSETDTPIPVT